MNNRDTLERWQHAGALTWDWVWPVALVVTALWQAAPHIEATLAPVLGTQILDEVVRTPSRLCWRRVSYKYRLVAIDNYDVFLIRTNSSGEMVRSFPEIFIEATGDPIATDRAPGVDWSRRRLCILLPPDIKPDQPIRLRQTIHFRGYLALWDVPWPLPEIRSPEGAEPTT